MIRQYKIFAKPFDSGHWTMFDNFSEEYTKTLGIPGKFVKKINTKVNLKNGTAGEMDSAYIADPDGVELFERVAVCLEHLSKPLGRPKILKLGDYDIQLVCDEQLPTLLVVASHLDPEKSIKLLIRSPSDITKVYFVDLSEENINKRLNTVTEIINNNEYLSTENALNLGVIVLYAPRERACEITEKVVHLYLKIVKDLEYTMELTLYSVITMMIDAYFDEEEDYRRLIDMMDEVTSKSSREECESTKRLRGSLEYANGRISRLEAEVRELKEQLNAK